LLNVTVLLAAVVSKPKPLIVSDVALAASFSAELATRTGMTLAAWTADPLLTPLDVTTAVKEPPARGLVVKVTVSDVAEADVTVPTALLLNVTTLFEAVVSKPKPLIVTVDALAARLLVLLVTAG
jgi:hypothetical protein